MESGDSDFLALGSDVLSGQHGGVGRRLVSVSLDLHTTGNSGNGLLSRKIGNVDESVVEPSRQFKSTKVDHNVRSKDVGNTKDVLALGDIRSEGNGSLVLRRSDFLGGLG